MDNNSWEQIIANLNAAVAEWHSLIKAANEQQKTVSQTVQDEQSIIKKNHKSIQAASNKEILRKQLELLAEYSRMPEGHEHMAECSIAMILLYRELTRPDNGRLSQKKSEAKQYEHK